MRQEKGAVKRNIGEQKIPIPVKRLGSKIQGNFMKSGKMKILKNRQKVIKVLDNQSWEFNTQKGGKNGILEKENRENEG